ncbi:MAG: hypothetical protein EOP86_19180 [Verrucomicrobiaceae bacterium]|nr:MAG: hypothetical protein EOP86_19180 [Verrucomicrobiaceae bacterium]
MTEQELLQKIHHAFQSVERPSCMTVADGDFECMDKDRTLHSMQKGQVTLREAFNPGYSIFTEILPEALVYFFEDFAELALLPHEVEDEEWFGSHFMMFLDDRFREKCDTP